MKIKSSETLVSEALMEIETISANEALKLTQEDKCNLIDIRDIRELEKKGRVDKLKPYTSWDVRILARPCKCLFYIRQLDLNKEMVLFCAGGVRSALAAKSLKEMGFEKVSHIDGGFGSIIKSDFKII